MDSSTVSAPVSAAAAEQFQFEETGGDGGGADHLEAGVEAEPTAAEEEADEPSAAGDGTIMGESFAADTRVIVTSSGEQFSLSSAKAIDLLGEEFVAKLKAEPGYDRSTQVRLQQQLPAPPPPGRSRVILAVTTATEGAVSSAPTSTTMTHEATGSGLVYCNLNDLDLAEAANADGYSFASLHSLADASTAAQQQERNPYSAVSSILLQGGILQLKSDPGQVGSIVTHSLGGPEQQQQQVFMTVDSRFGSAGGDRLVPTQFVSVAGSPPTSRPQDAIASILASMNTMTQSQAPHETTTLTGTAPLDYSTSVQEQEEPEEETTQTVGLDHHQFSASDRPEVLPLNLATSQHATVIQSPQSIQVQGIKRFSQSAIPSSGGLVTKKVIIATINGTQRILTPVSSPQMIALKSAPRLLADGTLVSGGHSAPITILQKSLSQATVPKPKPACILPTIQTKTVDNKTCRWKFENGQICGKVFTKTYNLTVHMRMHQDIRPFPCTVCEQTFRQKAHLQRHEATHGIDSMANRKRRKRPLVDENGLEIGDPAKAGGDLMEGEEEEEDDIVYRPFVEKRKFAPAAAGTLMKTEREDEEEEETGLDPMIEPIVQHQAGSGQETEKKLLLCPVNVGTNTEEMTRHHILTDEIEESTLEPVRFRAAPPRLTQVEQGVQYCEEDLLQEEDDDSAYHQRQVLNVKYVSSAGCNGGDVRLDDGGGLGETERLLRGDRGGHELKCERDEEAVAVGVAAVCDMDDEGTTTTTTTIVGDNGDTVTYSSQEEEEQQQQHYVTTVQDGDNHHHLIAHTSDGSYIDASGTQLVMSHDGELVGFVPTDHHSLAGQNQVVNISTSTNEHGQQVVIIENLHNHSPELQQEILRALMSDTSLIPLSHT